MDNIVISAKDLTTVIRDYFEKNNIACEPEPLVELCAAWKLGSICPSDAEKYVINFGKHKGKTVGDIFKDDPGYLQWYLSRGNPEYFSYDAVKSFVSSVDLAAAVKAADDAYFKANGKARRKSPPKKRKTTENETAHALME